MRRGLTLLELLIATSMMLMLAGVIGGLASAVQTSARYSQGHGSATQQARVALERITRKVRQATTAVDHPGFVVVSSTIEGWRFPDTLIVWSPQGAPANPQGPPLVRELVIFSPHPQKPKQLLEITAPLDGRALPLDQPLDQSPWREMIDAIKLDASSKRVLLTDQLRASKLKIETLSNGMTVGAIRFERELRPSAAQWLAYQDGNLAWSDLSWAQGICGSRSGLRQAWLRIELQLVPASSVDQTAAGYALPFLGSAELYYEMER
jgi:hypothetical protein